MFVQERVSIISEKQFIMAVREYSDCHRTLIKVRLENELLRSEFKANLHILTSNKGECP